MSSGAPTPAGTSVFTKHNWDMRMGYLRLNGWSIYGLLGWAFDLIDGAFISLNGWGFALNGRATYGLNGWGSNRKLL